MSHQLHITGKNGPIPDEDWRTAVEETHGVRINPDDTFAVNPVTDEEIVIPSSGLDVEFEFEDGWTKIFFFSNGSASFYAEQSFLEDINHPVRSAATTLAGKLDATIVGDEGEVYEW